MEKEIILAIFCNYSDLFYSTTTDIKHLAGKSVELSIVDREREYFDDSRPEKGCNLSLIVEHKDKLYSFTTEADNIDDKSFWQLYEVEKKTIEKYEYIVVEDLCSLTS